MHGWVNRTGPGSWHVLVVLNLRILLPIIWLNGFSVGRRAL